MDCDQVFMILTRGPFPTGARPTSKSKSTWKRAPIVGGWPRLCGRRWKSFKKRCRPWKAASCPAIGATHVRPPPSWHSSPARPPAWRQRRRSTHRASLRTAAVAAGRSFLNGHSAGNYHGLRADCHRRRARYVAERLKPPFRALAAFIAPLRIARLPRDSNWRSAAHFDWPAPFLCVRLDCAGLRRAALAYARRLPNYFSRERPPHFFGRPISSRAFLSRFVLPIIRIVHCRADQENPLRASVTDRKVGQPIGTGLKQRSP